MINPTLLLQKSLLRFSKEESQGLEGEGVPRDIVVCPQKLEILPPLPTELSLAKQTSALLYHTVHLHLGYLSIGVP